ncbi:unnamed protein product [Durusdinium trenchii]|uniref:Uncharacterized protein n=1 Tax=Durusdinium trenchii TaxID=1381693 RepID=A0ABP0NQE6_9DINO
MASLVVAWSIKNVICGIICLLALAWTGRKYSEDSSLQDVLDGLHENDEETKTSIESIEAWMAPTFQALPKHQERLQTLAAKHLLHSYFNLNYGLKIEGLQFHTSQRDPNAQALESLALLRRAPKLKAALQESSKGFHLKELASIALLLNRLMLREVKITFKVAWRLRNHSASAELSWEELHEVFCAALVVAHDWDQVIIHSESLKRGASPAFHERFRIGQDFAMGHIKSWWNLRKFVLKLSQQTLPPAPVYSFKTALPIYLALFLGYGNYQNLDCQDMKTHMQTLEGRAPGGRHPGRLNLSATR